MSNNLKLYKKKSRAIFLLTTISIFGILFLWFSPRRYTFKNMIGIIGFAIWLLGGFPLMLTWTIAIDDEAVYAMYTVFGKIIRIRKKILFKDIRSFTVTDVGWFMIYPFDKSRFRDIIIIQSNIKDYIELVNRILAKLDPSVVDPRVGLFLAGKYREAGVSTFFKDVFK